MKNATKIAVIFAVATLASPMRATAQSEDVIVRFEHYAVNLQAALMRSEADLEFNDNNILDAKAAQFATVKSAVYASLPPGSFQVLRDYQYLPMVFLRCLTPAAMTALQAHPDVVAVYENLAYEKQLIESLPLVQQPQAFAQGHGGAGRMVAILDTGVNYEVQVLNQQGEPVYPFHEDCLQGVGVGQCRVVHAQDFAPNDGTLDADGHGTNVAHISLGVAPNERIAALDVFTGGFASLDVIAAAIDWVIGNRNNFAAGPIVAMNMSLGTSSTFGDLCPDDPLADPIAQALERGILSVIAAGNGAQSGAISAPACVPRAVRVGATYDANVGGQLFFPCADPTTAADQVTCFSNSADFLTMWAPGCVICAGGSCRCGTSMAAPHVTGAVAVLRAADAFPTDSLDCTVGRLRNQGVAITDPRNGFTFDRLDLFDAANGVPSDAGDCNGDGQVGVNELLQGVRILLGQAPLSTCPALDYDGDGQGGIHELVAAVAVSLRDCPGGPSGNV